MSGVCPIVAAQNFRWCRFRRKFRRIPHLRTSPGLREHGTGWRLRPDTHTRRSRDAQPFRDTNRAVSIESADLHPSEGRARSSHPRCLESSLRWNARRPYLRCAGQTCPDAFERTTSRRVPFWRLQRASNRLATERSGRELPAGRTLGSPAHFTDSVNRFTYDVGIGVVLQRADLIKRAGIADIADNSHNTGAHLRIAAAEVTVKFSQFAVVFAQLKQIDFNLIGLPAAQPIRQVPHVVHAAGCCKTERECVADVRLFFLFVYLFPSLGLVLYAGEAFCGEFAIVIILIVQQ